MEEDKNNRLNLLDWLLIVVLLGSLSGFGWYWYQSSVSAEDAQQQFVSHWHNVMAIDMTLENEVSEAVILRGEDLIILVPSSFDDAISPENLLSYVGVQNLQELGMLSSVANNVFDPQDPEFTQMRLLVYSENGTKMTLVPLYQAGIRSISFNRDRLISRVQMNDIDTEQVIGSIILSDGTQRVIHLVPVHDQIFSGQATLVND